MRIERRTHSPLRAGRRIISATERGTKIDASESHTSSEDGFVQVSLSFSVQQFLDKINQLPEVRSSFVNRLASGLPQLLTREAAEQTAHKIIHGD